MNKYGKLSVITGSLVLPITIIISASVNLTLKSANNANIDITQSLAYLTPILGTTIFTFFALTVLAIGFALLGFKKDSSKDLSKLGILILGAVVVLSIIGAMINNGVSDVEDAYRKERNQEFLQRLEQ